MPYACMLQVLCTFHNCVTAMDMVAMCVPLARAPPKYVPPVYVHPYCNMLTALTAGDATCTYPRPDPPPRANTTLACAEVQSTRVCTHPNPELKSPPAGALDASTGRRRRRPDPLPCIPALIEPIVGNKQRASRGSLRLPGSAGPST